MSVGVTKAKIASGTKEGIKMKTPSPWAMISHTATRPLEKKTSSLWSFFIFALAPHKPRNRDQFTNTFFMYLQFIFNINATDSLPPPHTHCFSNSTLKQIGYSPELKIQNSEYEPMK